MKKSKKTAKLPMRQRRFSIKTLAIVAIVMAAAAITLASRQLASSNVTKTQNAAPAVSAEAARKFVTVKVAGREVQVDPQTGKIRPMTPEEQKQIADGLKTMLNRSTDGLEQVQHADGSVSMDLKGRFQNVAVIRMNDDETIEQSCVDNRRQAAAFFGIDPKLVGIETAKGAVNQPIVKTPPQKAMQ